MNTRTSKERKQQFLMFTKVLVKYLEQKDQSMHARAKEVIRDCAKKNKEGNPAYSCLSASMQSHLKQLVGEIYWKKAEAYLRQYLRTQYVKKGVPHEEAKRKAIATAQSAASPLALDGVTVPPSLSDLPVGRLMSSGPSLFSQRTTAALPLALGANNVLSSGLISSLPVGYPVHNLPQRTTSVPPPPLRRHQFHSRGPIGSTNDLLVSHQQWRRSASQATPAVGHPLNCETDSSPSSDDEK
mmetsp:Transcript_3683/g.5610  ORF Transcript_3683/g.5610 Transcript_3683/m.5610 type:complete len:241 (-) Transcript_3683:132-854(-)